MENKYLISVRKVDGSVITFESNKGALYMSEELNSGNDFVLLGNHLERVKSIDSATIEELSHPEFSENTDKINLNDLVGERVHVTKVDGFKTDFYATLDTHREYPNTYYILIKCSDSDYEGYGVYKESASGFMKEDCYTVIEDLSGKIVHVTMLNGRAVNFYATLKSNESLSGVYILKDCSVPEYNDVNVFRRDSELYKDFDYYEVVAGHNKDQMVEMGNVATPWIPSPEDIEDKKDTSEEGLVGKRVKVTKLDGREVCFYASLEKDEEFENLYILDDCSDPEYTGRGVLIETNPSFEIVDYYEVVEDDNEETVKEENLVGKRVHVTKLNGTETDFYATLTEDEEHLYTRLYILKDCSKDLHEGKGVYKETDDSFGNWDYYEVVDDIEETKEQDKLVGKRVHVTKLDGYEVDFYATLTHFENSNLYYLLKDCSDPEYENFIIFKNEEKDVYEEDEYTVLDEVKKEDLTGKRVHITKLDGNYVDFFATLDLHHHSTVVYRLVNCSKSEYERELIYKEDSKYNYGYDEDRFTVVDEVKGENLAGKRVHVTKLNGDSVDIYATLEDEKYANIYTLRECSDWMYENYGVYKEHCTRFGVSDYYEVVEDTEEKEDLTGKRVHVIKLDGDEVDFYATLEQSESVNFLYNLKDCSNSSFVDSKVVKRDNHLYEDWDYYIVVEDTPDVEKVREQYGLLSENYKRD